MRTVYKRRRIGAAIVVLGLIFGTAKATVFVFADKPLDCGIPFVQGQYGDNFATIIEDHCPEERGRFDEILFWMIDANLDTKVTVGEWIALPHRQED